VLWEHEYRNRALTPRDLALRPSQEWDSEYRIARAVIESGLAAAVLMDADGRVLEFSRAAERIFGFAREAVLGRELAEVLIPERAREAHRRGLRRYLETGCSSLLETRVELMALREDGGTIPVAALITAVGAPDGLAFAALISDLSRRRGGRVRLADRQALLSQAEELAGFGSVELDLRSAKVIWSDGMYRVLGVAAGTPPMSLEDSIGELVHPDDRAAAREELGRIERERPERFDQRLRIVRPDGAERVIEFRWRLGRDERGEVVRFVGAARDVTDELEARADRDMLSYVVESSDDAIVTESADGVVTSWNRGAERLYGYTADEAIGRGVASLIVPADLREEQAELTSRVFTGESVRRDEVARVRQDGSRVLVSLAISPVRDAVGRIVSAAIVARDVTERRRYEDQLEYLASHDHLTGLLNRRSFEEELERELDRAGRESEVGALLSVDLDAFKAVNDVAGHAAGDILLARVARALTSNTRASDIVARLGGDEFAVLLPNTGPARARAVAAKLLDALHGCVVQVEGMPFRATASIGVAMLAPGEARVYDLIVAADMAMYTAKQSGRDRIAVFTPSEAELARTDARKSWSHQIRNALENNGLVLYRQPIVDLGTGRPSHSELLLRMRQGDRMIEPGAFLESAERLGLIHAIDHWVVTSAVELVMRTPAERRRPVSINLSGESVAGDPELLALIRSELDVAGVNPGLLIFEVTETAAISNIAEAQAFAEGVRALGCRIALDDFGIGFGSFYHLKHLPADYVKIDHEFVHELVGNGLDQRIVSSIVEVATELGIETVAEAVGDEGTVRLLRDLGVDYGQGFFLGRPEPIDAMN
jgi:diguanylate cyclase (GGDEF)-like protein/PAS domain S-box-containing protein